MCIMAKQEWFSGGVAVRGMERIKRLQDHEVSIDEPACHEELARVLRKLVLDLHQPGQDLVLLCIGTDRCTGDALGPLIGTQLQQRGLEGVHVYGTLAEPVHATNLQEALAKIELEHQNALVIAIDACLGKQENVGKILVGQGPLKPGSGVNKNLPAVGDLYIIGIVNVGGFMDHFVLQNTRLYLINRLAQAIADGLMECLSGYRSCLPQVAIATE
jgi:putative sporulation protein YyaC